MTISSPAKSSFFDLYTNPASFQFLPYSSHHHQTISSQPTIIDTFTCLETNTRSSKTGLFALHKHLIAFYPNGTDEAPSVVLDVSFSRLVLNTKTTLIKGESSFDLQFNDKQAEARWAHALKSVCVLTDFHEKYTILRTIGRGNFAKVYLVESRTSGKFYAAKAFSKELDAGVGENEEKRKLKLSIINEISLLRDINYHNIANLSKVYETENSIYLLLDHVQGRTLDQILARGDFTQKYSDEEIAIMFLSILEGLAYLASKGIMHRDLKPANIIIEKEGKVKIVDFGFATYIDQPEYIFPTCGSPGFLALEIFQDESQTTPPKYDDRCDVFSVGCILFHMLFGFALYPGASNVQILENNQSYNYLSQKRQKIKAEIANKDSKINKQGLSLLLELLASDPKNRLSAIEALQHPYFRITFQNHGISTSIKSHALDGFHSNFNNMTESDQNSQNLALSFYSGSPCMHPKDRIIARMPFYEPSNKPEHLKNFDSLTTNMSSSPILNKRIQDVSPLSSIYLQRNNNLELVSSQLSVEQRTVTAQRERFSSFKMHNLEKVQMKIQEEINEDTPLKLNQKAYDFKEQSSRQITQGEEFNIEDDEDCKVHFFIEQMKVQPQFTIKSKS